MKKILFSLVVIAIGLVSFTTIDSNDATINGVHSEAVFDFDANVNLQTSMVKWKGFKPTGSHHGTVMLKSGTMNVRNGKIKSGEFIIDMTTIKDADGSKRLEGHLKSADFFEIKKYPTSSFVIKKVKKKKGKVMITGDITIKGITKSITVPTSISLDGNLIIFKSEMFKLNRAEFNVKYKSKSFFNNLKDRFINDEMEMSFVVKATK